MEIWSNWGWFWSSLTFNSPIAVLGLTEFCTVILLFQHLVYLELVRKKRNSEYQEYFGMKMILFSLIFVPYHSKWLFHLWLLRICYHSYCILQGVSKKTIRFWNSYFSILDLLTKFRTGCSVKYILWEFEPWATKFPQTYVWYTVAVFAKHAFFRTPFFPYCHTKASIPFWL